jgi:hypothetical protein
MSQASIVKCPVHGTWYAKELGCAACGRHKRALDIAEMAAQRRAFPATAHELLEGVFQRALARPIDNGPAARDAHPACAAGKDHGASEAAAGSLSLGAA